MSVPIAIIGVTTLWVVAGGLLAWSTLFAGPFNAGRWGLYLSSGAAAWTVFVSVRDSTCRVAELMVHAFDELVESKIPSVVESAAEETVRRLELRELEAEVARLVPRQHS